MTHDECAVVRHATHVRCPADRIYFIDGENVCLPMSSLYLNDVFFSENSLSCCRKKCDSLLDCVYYRVRILLRHQTPTMPLKVGT